MYWAPVSALGGSVVAITMGSVFVMIVVASASRTITGMATAADTVNDDGTEAIGVLAENIGEDGPGAEDGDREPKPAAVAPTTASTPDVAVPMLVLG